MKIVQVISHETLGVHQTIITFDVTGPNGLPLVASSVGGDRKDCLEWVAKHAPEAKVLIDT